MNRALRAVPSPPAALPAVTERTKRPLFTGLRFVVFEWMLNDLERMLGAHFEAFDCHEWFFTLDARTAQSGEVVPQRDGGAWLQARTLEEAQRRGLPIASAKPERDFSEQEIRDAQRVRSHAWGGRCHHDPPCETARACEGVIIRQWRAERA